MYDLVGGGFARYSTDDDWLVPHFEKMLYDNAQLARAYLHGFLVTGKESFRQVCEASLDFSLRELCHPQGGFFSSLDADSEGQEGKFYVWSLAEVNAAVSDKPARDLLIAAYGLSEDGNFEGSNILQRLKSDKDLIAEFKLKPSELSAQLNAGLAALLAARGQRVRPGTDDKVLTSWNALMLAAFAEAGRYLRRPDYTEVARQIAEFLLGQLQKGGRLLRSWRVGRAQHDAYLEDYAALILGLLALYQTDPDVRWYAEAERLASEMLAHFADPAGGFFDTRDDAEQLITRPKDLQDNATPSGSSLAATALLQLAAFSGNGEWRSLAEQMLGSIQASASRYPTAFGQWLYAMQFDLAEGREIAIVGPDGEATQRLVNTIWSQWRPFDVVAVSHQSAPAIKPPLLVDRHLKDGKATAYVCRGFVCKLPVTTVDELKSLL